VSAPAVAPEQDIEQVGFDDDTGGAILGELGKLVAEPLPGIDDGRDEIVERFSFDGHLAFEPNDGVVARRQRTAYRGCQLGIEGVLGLFARVDDDHRQFARTGAASHWPPRELAKATDPG
jgi:hypothetical protein